ncbi:MAG TPA: SDR family NAD(P)-dependent oxidoreductase [Candidatus Limnocylindrales bacterium]
MRLEPAQVAVVTGGASGLGLAMAQEFAARGLSIVLGDVERDALDNAVIAVENAGVPVLGVPTDVRFADQVDALAAATIERFGRVDIICNNAGVATMSGPTWEVPLEDWQWVLEVNLQGVVHGIRSFVPHLVAQNAGHVVNTASMAGVSAGPGMAPYLASKHAVFALSEGLAAELAEAAPGVRVTVVCPGSMDTSIATAERNRPAELNRPGPEIDPLSLDTFMAWINSITQPGLMSPADAAAIVVAAVEADAPRSFPNGSGIGSRGWMQPVIADLPAD